MRETEAVADARRFMEICNGCRYCEGFCAVFPAMELRRDFDRADLSYLANLCHSCRACRFFLRAGWSASAPPTCSGSSAGTTRNVSTAQDLLLSVSGRNDPESDALRLSGALP